MRWLNSSSWYLSGGDTVTLCPGPSGLHQRCSKPWRHHSERRQHFIHKWNKSGGKNPRRGRVLPPSSQTDQPGLSGHPKRQVQWTKCLRQTGRGQAADEFMLCQDEVCGSWSRWDLVWAYSVALVLYTWTSYKSTYMDNITVDVECLSVVDARPSDALTVELHKTSAGLGFSLEGGKSSSHGDRPLTVKRIFKGDSFPTMNVFCLEYLFLMRWKRGWMLPYM